MRLRSTLGLLLVLALISVCLLLFSRRSGAGPAVRIPAASPHLVVADPPPGQFYLGVFPGSRDGMGSDVRASDLGTFVRAVGKAPAWVYFSDNWYEGAQFPESTASWIRANGSVPYIRLMLISARWIPCPDPVYKLENIIRGRFDPQLRSWMRAAKHFGSPLLAEYGVEVDGFWFPWNGLWNREGDTYEDSVARFRQAYRHIIRIAREEGAYNIRWVFHADPYDQPLDEWNRFEHYYPGDEWIDWVGVSVYGRQAPSDEYFPQFRVQMDGAYRRLRALTNKPVIVCEFGSISDRGQAEWADAALRDLLAHRWPAVIGFSWWNSGFKNDVVNPENTSNMRIEDSPRLTAVFRSRVGDSPHILSRPIVAARSAFF